ncbi:unnamed protein product, partial [Iphiclides podalirius]
MRVARVTRKRKTKYTTGSSIADSRPIRTAERRWCQFIGLSETVFGLSEQLFRVHAFRRSMTFADMQATRRRKRCRARSRRAIKSSVREKQNGAVSLAAKAKRDPYSALQFRSLRALLRDPDAAGRHRGASNCWRVHAFCRSHPPGKLTNHGALFATLRTLPAGLSRFKPRQLTASPQSRTDVGGARRVSQRTGFVSDKRSARLRKCADMSALRGRAACTSQRGPLFCNAIDLAAVLGGDTRR